VKPEKLEPAAVRGHGRLEVEAATMTLAESRAQFAARKVAAPGGVYWLTALFSAGD
jgi:hypothetical protein